MLVWCSIFVASPRLRIKCVFAARVHYCSLRNHRTHHAVVTIPGISVVGVSPCAAGAVHRTSQAGSGAYLLSWPKGVGGSFTKGKSGRQVKLTSNIYLLVRLKIMEILICVLGLQSYECVYFVAAWSKLLACGCSPLETLGSNPAGGMDICLL